MNCTEFQKALPYIIDSGGNAAEQEHLRECAVCADLIADLRYIAEQAKLLVPMEDPNPKVWEGIQASLRKEGLVRRGESTGGFRKVLSFPASSGRYVWAAVAAVLVLTVGLFVMQRGDISTGPEVAQQTVNPKVGQSDITASEVTAEDQQLLAEVEKHSPEAKQTYADGLKQVNAYISDARNQLKENPEDQEAREYLMEAYEQRAMLYDMAISHATR